MNKRSAQHCYFNLFGCKNGTGNGKIHNNKEVHRNNFFLWFLKQILYEFDIVMNSHTIFWINQRNKITWVKWNFFVSPFFANIGENRLLMTNVLLYTKEVRLLIFSLGCDRWKHHLAAKVRLCFVDKGCFQNCLHAYLLFPLRVALLNDQNVLKLILNLNLQNEKMKE